MSRACVPAIFAVVVAVHLSVKREEGEEEDEIAAIDTNIIIIIIMIEKERLGYTGKRAFYWF